MNVMRNSVHRLCRSYFRKCHLTYSQQRSCSLEGKLLAHLRAKMKLSGPITVAEYMKEALTNATAGYYINRDVFGVGGDFITSPEISQMFGELVAVWFVNEWMMAGSPKKVQLVELGPGRGTMSDDMLRAFSKFPELSKAVSLHLVEISRTLSHIQEEKLSSTPEHMVDVSHNEPHYKTCASKHGPQVYWYKDISDVPDGFTMFVAHEFFDALPVHKFQKTDHGWREVLVDISQDSKDDLQFVLAPAETAASKCLLKIEADDQRQHIEVCPEGGVMVQYLANRISRDGGCALIADYGHTGQKEDTLRGFKDHALHDVLVEPGTADITADVDFSYLTRQAGDLVKVFGPATQSHFLQNMGLAVRLKILYERADEEGKADLISAYHKLTSAEEMGERFKFMALLHNQSVHSPVGFDPLPPAEEEEGTRTEPTS